MAWVERRRGWLHRITDIVLRRAHGKLNGDVSRLGLVGLMIFVALPFPGAGAWTGSLGAFILGGRAKGVAGLGELIGGALLVTVLAIAVDLALAWLQRRAARRADPAREPVRDFGDLSGIPVPRLIP